MTDDFGGEGRDQADAEALVRRVVEMLQNSKSVPLSTSVLISNKDELVELLEAALDRLPAELRQARWMLRERDEHLARVRREADEILDAARVRAERLVQRAEVVREAQRVAQRTLEEARDQANRLRMEAEDYCDQKLGSFEEVLDQVQRSVAAGRAKLRRPLERALAAAEEEADGVEPPEAGDGASPADRTAGALFDQDTV